MTATAPSSAVATPTLRRQLASWRFWIIAVLALLAVAVLWFVATADSGNTSRFGAANAGPTGGRAVAEVLRQQGVDVQEASSLDAITGLDADPATTTLLVHDPNSLLALDDDDDLREIAHRLVLIEPTSSLLERYSPDIALAGTGAGDVSLEAGCALPAAVRAGTIVSGEAGLQPIGADASSTFCFLDDDGAAQIAQTADGRITAVASASGFTNERVAQAGNGALILGLLGADPTLIWYEPGLGELTGGDATPADLTPEWVSPVLILLVAVFVAAAVWRGRRMGALVVERLPVVVRAGETIEGRARLYRRSAARLHSLDALRIGTIGRMATALRLPNSAPVEDIIRAVAAITRSPRDEIASLLIDDVPRTERDLIDAAQRLLDLERRVRAAIDVGGARGHEG